MNSKRVKKANIYQERNAHEALHSRNRNTITALNELMKDVALVKHKKTLDEVAKAMTRALENDLKWATKCQELEAELAANEKKMQIAIQLSEEDKTVIDTLKNELQDAWNAIDEMSMQNSEESKKEQFGKGDINGQATEQRVIGNDAMLEEMAEDGSKLIEEIEKGKLQVFELEEELTNKDKSIEELISNLNSKSKQLEDTVSENVKLKLELNKVKTLNNNNYSSSKYMSNKAIQSSSEVKFHETSNEEMKLKKKLQDSNKKDQISSEKIKHFLKKNKLLTRQLQIVKNQNNLLKLELAEQTRMLDLLSCQCCKLEEKDKKQSITIAALKSIRDKYAHMLGTLEQKIHEMKKKY